MAMVAGTSSSRGGPHSPGGPDTNAVPNAWGGVDGPAPPKGGGPT